MAIEYVPLATSSAEASEVEDLQTTKRRRLGHSTLSRIALPSHLTSRPRLLYTVVGSLLLVSFFWLVRAKRSTGWTEPEPGPNPYFHTGKIWEHNDQVAARLDRCASLGLLRNISLPLPSLSADEEAELSAEGCGTAETTVVILASLWFAEAYSGTSTTGETIYAQSVISTLNALGYAYVFSSLGWYNDDMKKTTELWHKHRWNTRVVLADPEQVKVCWQHRGGQCAKDESFQEGIEVWRLLSFWYWDDSGNPLGTAFTLSPSPRNENHFLSFSIEPTCHRLPRIHPQDRPKPPQVYLLAKQMRYLDNSSAFSWTLPALDSLQDEFGVRVVGGIVDDDADAAKALSETGITNFGKLDKIEFYEQLARSSVLLGVGRPRISPSPWDALCMGVPFINPILQWDEEDPFDRSKWHAQQWHMTDIEPPYVYHVHAHDLDELRTTVGEALAHPIESWIPDYMKFDFACERTREVIEGDWLDVARGILEERKARGEGNLFVL
ncbi:hypothetical protein BCR39DRAFT_513651 [Naematelia encephala]|uniref:Glycosyltransferase family 18 catalytic domain-containing protein n=1 Tax=Naematelia encephala TaxID=71784 RepID=A0A1Y2BIL3_9TREE|nr:hypothetical protein BCR39DRAFT_513651 [Naematelia encephala]